jgi:periplasmic protein CpxP/Spy
MQFSRGKILAVALGVMLAAGALFSQAVRPAHMHGHGMGQNLLQRYSDALDLTDAQQAQIKDIMAKEKPAMKPLMEQMFQDHRAMDDLVASGTFDEAKVRALAAQQAQTFQEMAVQKARADSEIVQVLTADQRAKLATLRQKHQDRMMQHMQGAPPEPPTD